MKPLFIVMALAGTLMTTGAALAHPTGQNLKGVERSAFRAQGWLPGDRSVRAVIGQPSVNRAHDVYVNGRYVGSDPDPFIRSQLARDNCFNNNTGC